MQVSQAEVKNFFETACGGEVGTILKTWLHFNGLENNQNMMCQVTWLIVDIISNLQVTRLRLLGDHVHSTRIAFVEFALVSFCLQPWSYWCFRGN